MTQTIEKTLDEQVNEAFASGFPEQNRTFENRETPKQFEARFRAANSAAARKVYELTRSLGLKRQTMEDAPAWKAPAGIPLNAFARRRLAGLLGEGLPGYPFDEYGRARVAAQASKAPRTRATRKPKASTCPHCGGSLRAA